MKLAERLNSDEILVAPGICDAFGMMMVANAGFDAAYLSGATRISSAFNLSASFIHFPASIFFQDGEPTPRLRASATGIPEPFYRKVALSWSGLKPSLFWDQEVSGLLRGCYLFLHIPKPAVRD